MPKFAANRTMLFTEHAFLDRIAYQGWIGCEYKPASTTADGLGWLKQVERALTEGRP
jgi:hydroxypyruvate isomerase